MDLLYYSALLYRRKTLPFLRSKTKNVVFPDPVPPLMKILYFAITRLLIAEMHIGFIENSVFFVKYVLISVYHYLGNFRIIYQRLQYVQSSHRLKNAVSK